MSTKTKSEDEKDQQDEQTPEGNLPDPAANQDGGESQPSVPPPVPPEPPAPIQAAKTDEVDKDAPPPPPEEIAPTLPIVWTFNGEAGEFVAGVPRRDLTQLDVERLTPMEIREATTPGPSGRALYTRHDLD